MPHSKIPLPSLRVKYPVLFTMNGFPFPCPIATRTAHGSEAAPCATMATIFVFVLTSSLCGGSSKPFLSCPFARKCRTINPTAGSILDVSPSCFSISSRVSSLMRQNIVMWFDGPSGPIFLSYDPKIGFGGG